jgi:3D-(3,5/4)-trihydroxycyclohexane-1,2-dione acylhydrolase (decyclizing)
MMNGEIVTSIQESCKLIIVLMDNEGFKSIGALSRSIGSDGFGTRFVYRSGDGTLAGDGVSTAEPLPLDLGENARSLGACLIKCRTYADFVAALGEARKTDRTTVIHVRNDRLEGVPSYDTWWDVAVAEVSSSRSVQAARREWEQQRPRERYLL